MVDRAGDGTEGGAVQAIVAPAISITLRVILTRYAVAIPEPPASNIQYTPLRDWLVKESKINDSGKKQKRDKGHIQNRTEHLNL